MGILPEKTNTIINNNRGTYERVTLYFNDSVSVTMNLHKLLQEILPIIFSQNTFFNIIFFKNLRVKIK